MTGVVAVQAASNLRAELARQNRKKNELAVLLGISPTAVTRPISGATPLDVNEVVAIAQWLDIPVSALLETAYRPTTDRYADGSDLPSLPVLAHAA